MTTPPEIILIPVKDFANAKSRLRDTLGATDALDMSRELAARTIAACAPRPCVVLCDNDTVEKFARDRGARVLRVRNGLNDAVTDGYVTVRRDCERVIVAHADLAAPEGLGDMEFAVGVTIVTDRHGEGTNVLVVPTGRDFHFSYGEGSAQRHHDEAVRLNEPVTVIRTSPWGLDIDGPEDLHIRNQRT